MTAKNLFAATKGIVFDLDDTLYSQRSFKLSGFRAIAEWLAKTFSLDANRCYQGLEQVMLETSPSYPYIFDLFIERNKLPPDCLAIMVRIFVEHLPRISCYPSARLLLSKLRRKYNVGILTDGRLTVQQKKVQALNIGSDVDMVLYSDAMGLEKPSSELYHWYEKRFSTAGEHFVYIGDNPHKDFIGAKQRGWRTVRVLTGEYAGVVVDEAFCADLEVANLIEVGQLFDIDLTYE